MVSCCVSACEICVSRYITWGANVQGQLSLDRISMYVPSLPDVYVNAQTGADTKKGTTQDSPLASVVRAAEVRLTQKNETNRDDRRQVLSRVCLIDFR